MKKGLLLITIMLGLASCAPTPGQPVSSSMTTIPPTANLPNPGSAAAIPSETVRSPGDNLKTPSHFSGTVTLPAEIDPDTLAEITAINVPQVERLLTLNGHTNKVSSLAFSGDGRYLASAGMDGKIRLWEISLGQEKQTFPIHQADLNAIAFSPDGNLLASAEAIWDVESNEKLHTLEQNFVHLGHVAFSPDGSRLIIAGFQQSTKLWDVSTGKVLRTFDPPLEELGFFDIVFSPDGKWAAGGANHGMVNLWDANSGSLQAGLRSNYEGDLHAVAFSPDGQWLAAGGTDEVAFIWSLSSGEVIKELRLGNGIYSLAISPDGTLLATAGCDRTVKLWEVASWKLLRSLPHADELMAVAFSPDGKLLAAGGYDNSIAVWGVSP